MVLLALALAGALALSGCSNLSETEQRTLTGGAAGAAGGAIIGAIAGNAGLGAAIGGGAGLAGGYIYDQHKKSQQNAYTQGYAAGQGERDPGQGLHDLLQALSGRPIPRAYFLAGAQG